MSHVFLQTGHSPERPDCLAGHVRLELRNVVAKYPFERSHRFPVKSGRRDYSRLSCDGGGAARGRMLALAGIAAIFCRGRDDPAAANPAIPLLTLRWTFPAGRASVGSICSAERDAMRARVIFISKHRCRLGGDCANLFGLLAQRSQGGLEPIFGSTAPLEKSWRCRQPLASNATILLKLLALPRGLEPLFSP
jgi:hypothetical protein